MIKYNNWKDYLERSEDPFGRVYPGEFVLSDDEYGFVIYDIDINEKCVIIHQMYGDGKHWLDAINKTAKQYKLDEIRWFTKRNPEAFKRKYNAKITGYTMSLEVE